MFEYQNKDDEKGDLEVIKNLMEQLVSEMKPGAGDFEERLGRKTPDIAMLKIEGGPMGDDEEGESPDEEKAEELTGMDLDHDDEVGESPAHKDMVLGRKSAVMDEDISPQEKLKKRIMGLRA